jgi:pimeloyl-ACP methyl ester carboxylesterase
MTTPIVFLHGAFCGGWAFDAFRAPFEDAGYETHAPNLLHHDQCQDQERLGQTGVKDYARDIIHYVRRLERPAVLIGHSMGGLVAQIAATQVAPAALVLLSPSAPWGVMPTTMDEHGNSWGLSLLGDYWRRTIPPDYRVARHATLDRLDSNAARKTFARFRHESGRAVMETVQWWLDPTMASAAPVYRIAGPVLGMAGARDRVNSSSTVRRIINRFPKGQAHFHEFADMSHWMIGEPGWEDAATLTLEWLRTVGVRPEQVKRPAKARFTLFGLGATQA